MLALEVTFLTGRYVATSFDDRGRAEWPPHPARLFSAFVAAHFDSVVPDAEERRALEWLENQGPPAIGASNASVRDVVTVFVPVNDLTVVGSLDDEADAVEQARSAAASLDGKLRAAADKKLAKNEARLADAIRRGVAEVSAGKEGKEGPALAVALLPERRRRQPRTFPSVTPEEPRVVFSWPRADVAPHQRAVLDSLASRVVRLGHSSSLVTVRLLEEHSTPRWIPDETGEVRDDDDTRTLRVAAPGQLGALDEAFAVQGDAPGRVLPAAFQRYVRPEAPAVATAASVFGEDWLVLRRVDGPRLPCTRAVDVARVARKALLAAYGEGAPEILSGHRAPGEASARPHLAYVPLPFVGAPHANGALLGIALVLPRAAVSEERRAVARALDGWLRAGVTGSTGTFGLPLHLGRTGQLVLGLPDAEPRPNSPLHPKTWCKPSRMWASATPVALDRNPGDLRAKESQKEAAAYADAEATIATACEHIGLPRPVRVTAMPAAPLTGAEKARRFPPFMSGHPPVQRVLLHAVLTFAEPVRGPIFLGAARYFGLGLFRPMEYGDD